MQLAEVGVVEEAEEAEEEVKVEGAANNVAEGTSAADRSREAEEGRPLAAKATLLGLVAAVEGRLPHRIAIFGYI